MSSEALPAWEVESSISRHAGTRAGRRHRARIAEVIIPLLKEGTILPTDKQIAAILGLRSESNAARHYSMVLMGLGVVTRLQRVTVRVVGEVFA